MSLKGPDHDEWVNEESCQKCFESKVIQRKNIGEPPTGSLVAEAHLCRLGPTAGPCSHAPRAIEEGGLV